MTVPAHGRGVDAAGVRAADYLLFQDWCQAARVPLATTTQETLVDFAAFTGGADRTRKRRLHNIITMLRDDGVPVWTDSPDLDSVWRTGDGWLDVGGALQRCPVVGWPDGLQGRRDAFLLVLVGELGWTRRQARAVKSADLALDDGRVSASGAAVSVDAEPLRCPACAVTRWLRVLSMCDLGRGEARTYLTMASNSDQRRSHDHELPMTDRRWETAWHLLPAVDRYGWLDAAQPNLSPRSISRIVASRQQALSSPTPGDEVEEVGAAVKEPGVYADLEWDELDARLDEICAAADEVLARTPGV